MGCLVFIQTAIKPLKNGKKFIYIFTTILGLAECLIVLKLYAAEKAYNFKTIKDSASPKMVMKIYINFFPFFKSFMAA